MVHDILHFFIELLRNPRAAISLGGYPLLMAVVFAETGLLVGFFLPGDSLLVTAGVLVSTGFINPFGLSDVANLTLLNVVLMAMAISGDAVGFWFGFKTGPRIFSREQSVLFRRDYLLKMKTFYEEHGGKTIILARFMPFFRTFAPIIAGVARMSYRRFAFFNVAGGVSWVFSMSVLGYVIGTRLDPKRIEQIVIVIICVSVLPPLVSFLRQRARRASSVSSGA